MEAVCHIVGAGDFSAEIFSINFGDLVIAVDGGYAHISEICTPDLVLGDFDSLGYIPSGKKVLSFPAEKDDTDMMLAVKYGIAQGFRSFYLYGALGGRFDHSFANIQVLSYLHAHGCIGFLIDARETMTVTSHTTLCFTPPIGARFSVFALSESAKILHLCGLHYSAEDLTIQSSFPIGVSNFFTDTVASVAIGEGKALCIWESRVPMPQIQSNSI